MSHQGSGSGGYAEYILRHAAKKLFGKTISHVEWKVRRNPDISDAQLEGDNGAVLKFSIATGFRNIQTLVRKLKTKTTMPHYIEIMACPTGCLNGGAQVRPPTSEGNQSRDLSSTLEKNYHELKERDDDMSAAIALLDMLKTDEKLYNDIFYTDFHEVEKFNLGIKW